jgi:hypothetical protein
MVPVLLLAGIIAFVLNMVKDIRIQIAILFSLGIIAFFFSQGILTSVQESYPSHSFFSPLSLFWALAIVIPLVIMWRYTPEKPTALDAVVCTLSVSALVFVLAVVLIMVALIKQSVLIDPFPFLQFVLPVPALFIYVYPPEFFWFPRFCIILALAALSNLLIISYRVLREKKKERSHQ